MKHVPEDWGYCNECEGQREHERHKRIAALEKVLDDAGIEVREVNGGIRWRRLNESREPSP